MVQTVSEGKVPDLELAVFEAKRFIDRAEAAIKKLRADPMAHNGCPETGAVKRASMDLTRALVRVRKPTPW